MSRWTFTVSLVGLLLLAHPATPQSAKSGLKTLSYNELGQKVRDLKGKVVVVYFWSFTCTPCKQKGVPTLIKLHEKYAKDGLVILGVLLDDRKDTALLSSGQKYLDRVKPPFEMVFMDFPTVEFWQKKLGFYGYPGVYVFNRENQYVKKLPVVDDKGKELEEVDYDVIEQTVAELMKK